MREGHGVERRSRAGLVLGTLTAKRVRRTPLDVPRGDATRTNSGRGSLPETPQAFRPRKTNHAMSCPSKACVKSSNLNAHLHCLNTINIENPTDILTVSTSDSRNRLATDDLLSHASRLKTAPVAAFSRFTIPNESGPLQAESTEIARSEPPLRWRP